MFEDIVSLDRSLHYPDIHRRSSQKKLIFLILFLLVFDRYFHLINNIIRTEYNIFFVCINRTMSLHPNGFPSSW